jgi:hypothetical protein
VLATRRVATRATPPARAGSPRHNDHSEAHQALARRSVASERSVLRDQRPL